VLLALPGRAQHTREALTGACIVDLHVRERPVRRTGGIDDRDLGDLQRALGCQIRGPRDDVEELLAPPRVRPRNPSSRLDQMPSRAEAPRASKRVSISARFASKSPAAAAP